MKGPGGIVRSACFCGYNGVFWACFTHLAPFVHLVFKVGPASVSLYDQHMQFLVLGFDGDDDSAGARRSAARPHHIALGDEMLASGSLWYGAALTGDDGNMIGSMYMVDFAGREELDNWLAREPYVVGDVWRRVEVHPCSTRDPWQFNRPKEFFESRMNK